MSHAFRQSWRPVAGVLLASLAAVLLYQGVARIETVQAARGVGGGFSFLWQAAGFRISESLLSVSPADAYAWAIAAGLVNTLTVAAVAIPLATLLGIVVGLLRLSRNPLVAGTLGAVIEPLRNTPVLLQLFVWYALLLALPDLRQAWTPLPGVFLSNRGLAVPLVHGLLPYLGVLAAGLAAARWLRGPRARLALLGAVLLAGFLLPPLALDMPQRRGFGFDGGWMLSPEFGALTVGLIVFHAAYLSDIVRGAILSVPLGQLEAGQALGLARWRIGAFVLYPYAARIALPPIANQYLTLVKNSTLAVAIGYQDLMAIINTTITQTGLALEGVSIAATLYLCIGALLAAALSRYNAHITRTAVDQTGMARLAATWRIDDLSRARLFGTPARAVATLITVLAIGAAASRVLDWALLSAVWQGPAQACGQALGACWAAVTENHRLLLFGGMPAAYHGRALAATLALGSGVAVALLDGLAPRWRLAALGLGAGAALVLLGGLWPGGHAIAPVRWGGLVVTVVLAVAAIGLSLPLAVCLALLRRSASAWLRLPATLVIEAVRGVPLITQLVLVSFLVPMLFGGDWSSSKLGLALIALTLHTACLLAEVLRGALQAVGRGQWLAADALGLHRWQVYWLVILPQARRIAAPAALGVFVGAVKDTSLVMVIGLFDVLSAAKAVIADGTWRPYYLEIYLSVAAFYFVVCLLLSRTARRMARQAA